MIQSKVKVKIRSEVTLRLTVSQYVLAWSPPWDLRPDINSVCREVGSVSCQSLSAIIVHRQVLFYFISLFPFHTFYVYTIYARPSQPRLNTADNVPSFVVCSIDSLHSLGTNHTENASPNISFIVASCGYCSDHVENTVPMLLFMAIT
jgi:hypothetical protein